MSRAPWLVVFLFLATPVLAGCLSASEDVAPNATLEGTTHPAARTVAHAAGGGPVKNASAVAEVLGVQRSLPFPSFEPTLGANADGTLFMTALVPGGLNEPTIMRSRDGGTSWEDVGPMLPTGQHNPPITGDPYVYVDVDTGRVFTNDLQLCAYMSWSDDEGATWFTNPLPCGIPVGFDDHQTLVAAKPRALPTAGYPNVLYYCINRIYDAACTTSLNGGLNWGPLVPTYLGVDGGELCGGLHGHVVADAEGRVYVPKGHCGVPMVSVSEDDGLTWTRHVISDSVPAVDHEVALAIDDAGNVFALWMADGLPVLAISEDGARSWTEPVVVSAPGVTATEFPAIAAGADGRVAFAYVGTNHTDGYDADDWKGATWNAYIGVITDAFAENFTIITTMANDPADPIARGVCGGTRCDGMGDFIDIIVDGAGRPWAAFVDVCTAACVSDASVANDAPLGFVGTLERGPALRGERAALPQLS